ncbi:hypothetical protein DM01DRAFT_1026055 [Hesseltinella vesiculosa]|uniref:Uncharacterized protein n=1 Tax=Hesseltinella vesiculosa TaxID=101127 RepID=A0A1X2GKD0_9FUNG|nr:hypothetical protein DM01DRAFT_1026055 [Hesseltinella vesiculosa]
MLTRLSEDNLDARDLGEVIRQEIIPPKDFRFMRHYDLRSIEKIAGHWIDLLLSPFGLPQGKSGERTSAIDGAILILNNIFLRFNDFLAWEWIEICAEGNATKNHKFDGVLTTRVNPKKSIMLVEFAGGFGCSNKAKLKDDTLKAYRNALRLLDPQQNQAVFVVLSWGREVHFETLKIIDNNQIVRTQQAKIIIPCSPEGIKAAMLEMEKVFGWRDTVVKYVKEPMTDSPNVEVPKTPNTP